MLEVVAIIPARGGSKGVPRKNVRPLCGKPLIGWTIEAARGASLVTRTVVSTDDPEIAEVSRRFGAEVVWRPPELSTDTASSEQALLHALGQLGMTDGALAFLQCTAPLILPEDIDGALRLLEHADSVFTATPWHRFTWHQTPEGVVPVGHSKGHRPMRQELSSWYLEVGAVYAVRVEPFLLTKTRFAGRTEIYPIPAERSLEIDDELDFALVEAVLRRRLERERAAHLPDGLRAVVLDFDGVLTSNHVWITETGAESVACHRGDGWAIARLKELGIRVAVLTGERNPVVRERCRKLNVECLVAQEKLPALRDWLQRHGIDREEAVYVGNDVPDVPCMQYVGCGVAPADAYPPARSAARVTLTTRGGEGCVRELYDLVMERAGSSRRSL